MEPSSFVDCYNDSYNDESIDDEDCSSKLQYDEIVSQITGEEGIS